jgi:hypothetical protein
VKGYSCPKSGKEVIKVDELHCLMCHQELPEDNFGRRNALVLTDEREQIPATLGAWCNEACMGEWLVKTALDAMMKRMMSPSTN